MFVYFTHYFHTYIVHVGAWGAYYGFVCIQDEKEIKWKKLLMASFLLATFSSLAHNHFMQFLRG